MTYFSDFDTVDYYNDEYSRKLIFNQAEDMILEDAYETVPEDVLRDLDLLY